MASAYIEAPAADSPDEAAGADKKPKSKDWEKLHEDAKKLFKQCVDKEAENRKEYVDDVKFGRLGGKHQWPDQIVTAREAAGKPCLSINMMPAFIHQVINDTRQNKPAITVRPVDSGADRKTALVIAGIIRHIENVSHADVAHDTAVDNSASGGFGYIRVVIDWTHDDSFDKEIYIRRVEDPLTIYGDPRSMSVDGSDWNDAFVMDWMPKKEFEKKYPGKEASDFDSADAGLWWRDDEVLVCEWWHRKEVEREIVKLKGGSLDGAVIEADQYDDPDLRPLFDMQGSVEVDRRTAKSWEVCQYKMSGKEILEENDHPGKFIPIIPVYGEEVVVEGKRYLRSLIRDGKDPQRNFNYWRSKASETAALAAREAWMGEEDAFKGEYADRWDQANVNHAFYAYPKGATPPQRVTFGGQDPAAMQQAASAADDMNRTIGIYQAGLGAPSNETSGRAINARKQEGDVGTFHFTDNLSRAIRREGEIVIDLLPHVYTAGRTARVLGVDGKEGHVKLGEKVKEQPDMAATPTPPPMEKENEIDFGAIYDIGLGKYDVVVSAGPGYTTKRQEAADQMMQMVQGYPQLGSLVGDLIAENLDWPGAEKFAERIRAMLPPQIQALINGDKSGIPPQMMQQIEQGKQLIQQLYQALQKAQAELQQAKEGNDIEAMKQQVERMAVAVDGYKAETDRMKAEWERGQMVLSGIHNTVMAPGPMPKPQPMQRPM